MFLVKGLFTKCLTLREERELKKPVLRMNRNSLRKKPQRKLGSSLSLRVFQGFTQDLKKKVSTNFPDNRGLLTVLWKLFKERDSRTD